MKKGRHEVPRKGNGRGKAGEAGGGAAAENGAAQGREEMGAGAKEGSPRARRGGNKGKVLIAAGAALVLAGLLTLAGVYIYIYHTNRVARGAQQELMRAWEENPKPSGAEGAAVGDGIARITAPRIGLDAIVVELRDLDDSQNLKRGPGHLPQTAYPGQPGNCVISGHRTTYGAPFRHIEQLTPGEVIILSTADHRYTYEVHEQRIVAPTDLTVLEQGGEPKVTLTACHPWYSAAQRIVVIARLVRSEELE